VSDADKAFVAASTATILAAIASLPPLSVYRGLLVFAWLGIMLSFVIRSISKRSGHPHKQPPIQVNDRGE
jgi:membrane protein implicated in regulation of membrane protease activity